MWLPAALSFVWLLVVAYRRRLEKVVPTTNWEQLRRHRSCLPWLLEQRIAFDEECWPLRQDLSGTLMICG